MRLACLRLLSRALARSGFGGVCLLGRLLGAMMWHCLPSRRAESIARVERHLNVSGDLARDIACTSFRHSATAFLEIFLVGRFCGLTDERLRPSEGAERCRRMIATDRPIVMALGHWGSWELMASVQEDVRHRPLVTVVRAQRNPALNTLIHELRGSRGMLSLDHRDVSADVLKILRGNGIAAFLVDHNANRRDATFLPFLGEVAAVNRGPALLAVRAKALVYPFFLERHPDMTYTMHMGDPLDTACLQGSISDKVEQTAAFYTKAVEDIVRKVPEQWFWMHRRWKTRPKD